MCADACSRCGGHGWTWDGRRRMSCPRCDPPRRPVHSPTDDVATFVRREDWPVVRDRLRAGTE